MGEAIEWSPTPCWHGSKRHAFFITYFFWGSHVRRIRLIAKNLRVNIIDTVFFTVTCFVREVCLFWHVLPLSAHSTFFFGEVFVVYIFVGPGHVAATFLA